MARSAPSTHARAKRALVLVSVGFVLVFALGVVAGRFTARYAIARTFGRWDWARTLGQIADAQAMREEIPAAYRDPEAARKDLDAIPWVLPNVSVPFLGSLSMATDRVPMAEGFRAAAPPTMPKPARRFRVFLIGGSTAFSVGARSEDATIGAVIERGLEPPDGATPEVFTFANPSWASPHERIALAQTLAFLEPDLVVALSGVNDTVFAQLGRDPGCYRTHYEQTFFQALSLAHRLAGRGPMLDACPPGDPISAEVLVERVSWNATLSAEIAHRAGATYMYVLQPTIYTAEDLTERERAYLERGDPAKAAYFVRVYPRLRGVLDAVEAAGGVTLDLSRGFGRAEGSPELFIDGYHFGDRGSARVGDAIAEAWNRHRTEAAAP